MPTSGTSSYTVVGGEYFYDSGGASSNYSNNESGTITFNSAEGTVINVVFSSFRTRNNSYLYVYDGAGTSSSLLGSYSGNTSPGTLTSTGNSITFYFDSNNKTQTGWAASLEVIDESDVTPTYCDSYGSTSRIGITSVDFDGNEFTSSSYDDYDDDYIDSPITISPGGTYSLSVNATSGGGTTYVCAWIDWNQDGTFSDTDEYYDLGSVSRNQSDETTSESPLSIVVPVDQENGNIGMRISAEEYSYPSSCDEGFDGEVEDYTLSVLVVGNAPVAICQDISVELDDSGSASITAADINNGSNDVETADVDLVLSLDQSTFDCSDLGTNTITLNVEDEDGNVSECTSTVTVSDIISPTASCTDITIELDASGSASISGSDLDNGSTDNCAVDTWSVSKSSFTDADLGANTVVLTVTDVSGNSSTCSAIVIVEAYVPVLSISVGASSINENGGSTTITASLDIVSESDVTVDLSVSGSVSSSDYSLSNSEIVIPAGSLSASVSFTAVDNDSYDGDVDVTVEVSSVSNANENGNQEQTITIIDDDAPSIESIEVDDQSPENTYTAEELVENVLVTGCLVASNITYSGDEANGLGYFNQGDSDFPLSSGIIISTGYVDNAEGPNGSSYYDNASDNIGGISDDVDADVLTSFYGQDVQILEFDFVPAGDELEFNYIFASEEYPEYVGYGFNDVFAFILSGPGIDGDYQDNGENIALIPGTSEEVAINSVNSGSNSTYYVDESSGYATIFDGRTTVLTASATVQACETYHIRLIIADVGDSQYNSAVFLEANSFSSNEVEVDNMIGSVDGNQDVMYEGCEGSFMRFNRAEDYDIDEEIEFSLNIAGTADNESTSSQDYIYVDANGDMIGDGVFPTTITIPAGDEYADYYYEAVADDEVEDDETIIFRIDRCPCDDSEYYETTVTIINSPDVEAVASAAIQCEGSGNPTATISVQLVDGISSADYLYSFDGGVTFSSDNVYTITSTLADGSDLVGTTFDIVVKDLFSCSSNTITLETTIPEIEAIAADAGGDVSVCFGEGVQLSGSGGIYYEWTCSTSGIVDTYLSDASVSNPWVSDEIPAGTYEFTLLVQDQEGSNPVCSDQESMTLKVLETPEFTSVTSEKYALCSGEETFLQADVSMTVSYDWNPSSGLDDENSATPVFSSDVSIQESRSYTLTVTASNGCSAVQSLNKAITVYPNPSISLNDASSNLCTDGTTGEIHIDVTGGTPNSSSPYYTYEWSHNSSLNSTDATSLGVNTYTVTVTDSKLCSGTETYTITTQPQPKGVFFNE